MNIEIISLATAVTVGLVEVVKKTGLNIRFVPLASVIVGVGVAFLFTHTINAAIAGIGIMIGLSACGLYSGVKTTAVGASK